MGNHKSDRRTAEFSPTVSIYEILIILAPEEMKVFEHPTVIYMRQEIQGLKALQEKTLRQLGLISGRAILRLLNKSPEELKNQANVSSVLHPRGHEKETNGQSSANEKRSSNEDMEVVSCTSKVDNPKKLNFVNIIKQEMVKESEASIESDDTNIVNRCSETATVSKSTSCEAEKQLKEENKNEPQSVSKAMVDPAFLERRLNIESEVTFLGSQKAIAFTPPDDVSDEIEDLPDDFYDLSIEEVRKLYHDLQKQRLEMENAPLVTGEKRQEMEKQTLQEKLSTYKNVVVRIQFPDQIILQGVFEPVNTIKDIINFIKQHLRSPEEPFQIFTTPFKESLDPNLTLLDAKLVPCVLIHFKREKETSEPYLKDEIYTKKTPSDAANILASKYRAPSRRKFNSGESANTGSSAASSSKNSKLPKWFKL
ncbi:Tether containing UBX domain for GLUT4 [Eumeta japonica]|uniref:Tether containing UBX domain for GLUT4 n=1 Tax=Eumeta variegata TaxID=151549 RepID=A0A4C1U0X0_EUMVA|nr:Tether containing UBX domain for GLUT4 [Eumeta japonica]